jgi:hypothetical protein
VFELEPDESDESDELDQSPPLSVVLLSDLKLLLEVPELTEPELTEFE